MSLKGHFTEFFKEDPGRLHFAAHSHHPWPDVAFEAHKQYWLDSARLVDDKWDYIFGTVIPDTQRRLASILKLPQQDTLTFAPNTHELLKRVFSCLAHPVRILSTGSEFHSFSRQSRRWVEAGDAVVERISTEPFASFGDRFANALEKQDYQLVYLSSVFFDSGYVVPDLSRLVEAVRNESTFIVIDGYHQFMALPTDLSQLANRVFFLAGGYKYAMAGEGVCFLHAPDGYGPRPVDTGWYAGFGQLESGISEVVPYSTDGSRFSGATYDPSGVYRLRAVLGWLEDQGLDPDGIHNHVIDLQERFLAAEPDLGELLPGPGIGRGNFLTFRSDDAEAHYQRLHDRGVVTDRRGDRLRIGFGVYQTESDVDRLIQIISE